MSEQSLPVVGDVVYQDIDPDLRLCYQYNVENIQPVNRWDGKNELWDDVYILRGVESGERCYVYGSSFYQIDRNQCTSNKIEGGQLCRLWRFSDKNRILHGHFADGIQNLGVSSRGCDVGDSVEKCFDGMKPGELDMLAAGASAKGLRIILAQYMDLVYRQSRNLYDSADIPIEEEHGLFLSRNEVNIRQLLEAGFSFDQYKVLLDIVRGPSWASPPRIAHPFESKEFDTAKRIFELRAEADELESELGYNV